MSIYKTCPNCGNTHSNAEIISCINCNLVGCHVPGGFFSKAKGCLSNIEGSPQCPNCGTTHGIKKTLFSTKEVVWYEVIGKIQ